MLKTGSEMGFSPCSRTKVIVEAQEEDDSPLSEFLTIPKPQDEVTIN
jgi:phage terminase small subunit